MSYFLSLFLPLSSIFFGLKTSSGETFNTRSSSPLGQALSSRFHLVPQATKDGKPGISDSREALKEYLST